MGSWKGQGKDKIGERMVLASARTEKQVPPRGPSAEGEWEQPSELALVKGMET